MFVRTQEGSFKGFNSLLTSHISSPHHTYSPLRQVSSYLLLQLLSLLLLSSLSFLPTVTGVVDEGDGPPDVWQQLAHQAHDGAALRGVGLKAADETAPTLRGRRVDRYYFYCFLIYSFF